MCSKTIQAPWKWLRYTSIDQETKHLNVRLHHFRNYHYVERQEISIHAINTTNDQPADYLTKALNEDTLKRHRLRIMGW